MRYLLFVILLFSSESFAQISILETDKVFHVNRRDSATISVYNNEFVKTLKAKDIVFLDANVSAFMSKFYKSKPCLGDVTLYFKLKLEAKDNSSRLSFSDVQYVSTGSICPTKGALSVLLHDCDKCTKSKAYIKEDYIEYKELVYKTYHMFLKEKENGGN